MIYGFESPTECLPPRIRIELQNIGAFQALKPSRHTFDRAVLAEEIGHRAAQYIEEPADAECGHGRLMIDDCDECERY